MRKGLLVIVLLAVFCIGAVANLGDVKGTINVREPITLVAQSFGADLYPGESYYYSFRLANKSPVPIPVHISVSATQGLQLHLKQASPVVPAKSSYSGQLKITVPTSLEVGRYEVKISFTRR